MKLLLNAINGDTEFAHSAESYKAQKTPLLVNGVCDSVRPLFCYAFSKRVGKKPLIIVPEEKLAYSLKEALEAFGEDCLVFPSRDFMFDDIAASSKDFEQERISVLKSLAENNDRFLITVPDAFMQYTVSPAVLGDSVIPLKLSMRISPEKLIEKLISIGYSQCESVEGKGQFSHRGGIVDVFSPSEEYPCRVDFFGDEPDSIGIFDTITQRRIENTEEYKCVPVCESGVTSDGIKNCINGIDKLLSGCDNIKARNDLERDKERLKNGILPGARDRYFSLLYNQKASVLDYLGDVPVIIAESRKVTERAKAFAFQTEQIIEGLVVSGKTAFDFADVIMRDDDFIYSVKKRTVALDYFMESSKFDFSSRFDIQTKQLGAITGSAAMIADEISDWLEAKSKVVYFAHNEREAENLSEILRDRDIPVCTITTESDYVSDCVNICVTENADIGGFEIMRSGLVALTSGGELIRNPLAPKRKYATKFKKAEKIASYSDLAVGDYVVHANHGIGVYAGIKQLTVEGAVKDFIKINYAGGDALYVPCGQLDLVSKYIGSENVKISKMGNNEWARTKAKAKAAAKDIAKDLIKLYAERKSTPGYQFPPDDDYQEEFECMFEYDETEGQITAINEIKADMQKPAPMDRLLCGDVGFGKTEVALRAVFKCVSCGKQAAILVPTTILALQHYRTMLSRFREFPVNIEMLSRFRTKKELDDAIANIKSGKTDVVVGTHKLLQKGIQFKNLGLLVIDEEQRFGVKHKEILKEITKNIDVLTLTATPIPRTLNMALTGIRDMSVLEEAPTDRCPVQSYVLEHDEEIIYEAIRRELRRGGQVFYLHNVVDTIYKKAAELEKEFPSAVVAIGHGQMSKDELSSVWQAMANGEVDILVCTTIIETGVDVPNANTLIVEDADRMGLSQLHQIRGRVGRSPRKAYAYFTYRRESVLSEVASKRLQAIREFTEFGSGFKIAMRDLEIRGAGNLLGAEQSGHMQSIGYDLYVKILEEAVNEEKGILPSVKRDCLMELNVDAYIPESYVFSPKTRIDFYRKIALLESESDRDDLVDEMLDRFGDIPDSVENLMNISLCRNRASSLGFAKITQSGNILSFYRENGDKETRLKLLENEKLRGRILLGTTMRPYFSYKLKPKVNTVSEISLALDEFDLILTKKV